MQSFRGEMVVRGCSGICGALPPKSPHPPPHTLQYFPSPAFSLFFIPLFVCSVGWILITAQHFSILLPFATYPPTELPSFRPSPPCTTRTRIALWQQQQVKKLSKFKMTNFNKYQDGVAAVEGRPSVRMGGERRRRVTARHREEGHSLFVKSDDF